MIKNTGKFRKKKMEKLAREVTIQSLGCIEAETYSQAYGRILI